MDKIKVLFVDDDITFGNIIMLTLNELGYDAYYQSSLTAIKHAVTEINPNIIVLDVEVGNKNSIDSIPEIRAVAENVPIIFVSSHVDSSTIARAIGTGGVAYLKKPFETQELIAYIDRHATTKSSKLEFGNCILDVSQKSLYHNVVLVKQLSVTEHKLLKLLILNINDIVTREEINAVVWENENRSEHSTNNFITKLRAYIAQDSQLELISIPRVGYKLMTK